MRTTLLFIVLFGIFASCFAAVSRGKYSDPKHPGKCSLSKDLILSPGEHKDPRQPCARITCAADGSTTISTCGVREPPKGHKFWDYKDTSLNYPNCCERELIKL